MPMSEIAESLARIEHKLDLVLKHIGVSGAPPMHFQGQYCPACMMPVDYVIDMMKNIVVRRCGCTTGKQPSAVPLTPLSPQGVIANGNTALSDKAPNDGR